MTVGDVENGIPFNDYFDLITCVEVVEHLKNPIRAIKNMLDKLNSSGRLLITTPNRLTEFLRCLYLFIKRQKRTKGVFWDKTHISVKTPQEWLKILQAFHNIKIETLTNFVMPWLGDRGFAVKVPMLGSSTLIVLSRKRQ